MGLILRKPCIGYVSGHVFIEALITVSILSALLPVIFNHTISITSQMDQLKKQEHQLYDAFNHVHESLSAASKMGEIKLCRHFDSDTPSMVYVCRDY